MFEKRCSGCKNKKIASEDKSISQFWKNKSTKDGFQTNCKNCFGKHYRTPKFRAKNNLRSFNFRKEIHKFIYDYFNKHPCVDCGEKDPVVLEFDHRVPEEKVNAVSSMIKNQNSLNKIKEEVSKCDVRCANCHKRKTAKDQNWYKYLMSN
jgi:hypothetical protein